MARSPSKPYHCSVISEDVSIALRRRSNFRGDGKLYVQCSEVDCQWIDANEPPVRSRSSPSPRRSRRARRSARSERSPTSSTISTVRAPRTATSPCSGGHAPRPPREVFEEHWEGVIFGPCIEGAVFEGRFAGRPRVSLLDGYVTVQVEGGESWHFHLCIGPHRGAPGAAHAARARAVASLRPRHLSAPTTPRAGRAPGGSGCGTVATSRC